MAKTTKTAANQAPKTAQAVGSASKGPLSFASKPMAKKSTAGGKGGKKC